tara:strand:+ start:511 stop:1086 length:576 start_codon:yes stop_codon:yes gene_type:complete
MASNANGDALKVKQLAIALSKLPVHPQNSAFLEQYQTEGNIAAKWLHLIQGLDGLSGKSVLDLGAGNGILGHGAQLLGAKVIFVEVDKEAASLCERLGETICGDVTKVKLPKVDIVIMNPPWGVQRKGADRAFLEVAKASGKIVHFMHSSHAQHLKSFQSVMNGTFRLPGKYTHHTSQTSDTPFTCYRWEA